jgi:alpha-amylase
VLEHWQKVGRFRRAHPAVGAGTHRRMQADPYIFSRTLDTGDTADRVLVAMGVDAGSVTLPVFDVFAEGAVLVDAYSGRTATVTGGEISLVTDAGLILLAQQ